MPGAGYNIPVSVSNAQTPSNFLSAPTVIQFGNGYLSLPETNTVTPTSTATSAAAEGNAAAQSGGAGTLGGAEGSSLTAYAPWFIVAVLGLYLLHKHAAIKKT